MTDIAQWMMALSVDAPLAGAFIASVLSACRSNSRTTRIAAELGVLGSFVASLCLTGILFCQGTGQANVTYNLGLWFELSGPHRLSIEWILHADFTTAIWASVVTGLASLTIIAGSRSPQQNATGFAVTGALVVASSIGFVLAANLVQMLICWSAIAMTTMAMMGYSSSRAAPIRGMQRAIQAGLFFDVLLLWAVLSIGALGSTALAELSSARELARIAVGNQAFLGLIGSLLVFSIVGRCGLFPCFGWHYEAGEWEPRQCVMVYCIGYVPSGLWLLLKSRFLLAAAGAPLETAGGLGTLGAVLAAFVACGQSEPRQRLAYLIGSQVGLVLAALGSGSELAVPLCVWHLAGMTLSAFLLFASMPSAGARSRALAWCAALSMAGALPFSMGWSQFSLTEMNLRPVSWRWGSAEAGSVDEATVDATRPANQVPAIVAAPASPRWGWVAALLVAQFLSALAVIQVVNANDASERGLAAPEGIPLRPSVLDLLGVLLLIAGPVGWWLGFLKIPIRLEQWAGMAIGQVVAGLGLLAGWRLRQTWRMPIQTPSNFMVTTTRWNSVARLSQNRLHLDYFFNEVWRLPKAILRLLATSLESAVVERAMTRWVVGCAAWFGGQIELQQIQRVGFSVAAVLLGTAVLLLTLILVT